MLKMRYNNIQQIWIGILFCLLISVACSCNNGGQTNYKPIKVKINVRDSTFDEYIRSAQKTLRDGLATQLKVQSIENDPDAFQIRIYKLSAFGNDEKMIILDSSSSSWSAKLVWFSVSRNFTADTLEIQIKKVLSKKPQSSWSKLIRELKSLDIFGLPDSDDIANPDYSISTDAGGMEIEYTYSGKYRVYSIGDPDGNQMVPEAKKIVQIANLIESEFGFKGFGYPEL